MIDNQHSTKETDSKDGRAMTKMEREHLLPGGSEEEKRLGWLDIEANVPMIGKSENARRKKVLQKVSGIALPREVLAIMGGSGAVLKIFQYKGVVLVNGKVMTKERMRCISAYVQQIDLFCGTLTVKEQLTYSALLRMGDKYSYDEKLEKVEEVIKDMNLTDCQNTLIGIPNRKKGISVGEKKRLAFGSEILTDPAILFCDEPTSGLDSYMACQVVTALQIMAKKGKTVVTVIHQPGSVVFNMFHRVCFMALGKPIYFGKVSELIGFFASLGRSSLRIPESYNPADHFIAEMFEESDGGEELKDLIRRCCFAHTSDDDEEDVKYRRYAASIWVQISVLLRRAFLTTIRDPVLLQITSVAIGVVNFRTEVYGPSIQNLEGVMYNCVRDMSFLFFYPSINGNLESEAIENGQYDTLVTGSIL
ncbi:ABC transporter, ATP-binding protein [Dictyocaulus viviparus]|uniref:ABC transporter, ATP-binding protein n=1 Tax=Dictyocaulus viviparus TaxID=29172 RepID=A0A0D8Y2K3_DICVI|nr:ABC transporter, ATP-binding protein [Dictyocaulus viviparus]